MSHNLQLRWRDSITNKESVTSVRVWCHPMHMKGLIESNFQQQFIGVFVCCRGRIISWITTREYISERRVQISGFKYMATLNTCILAYIWGYCVAIDIWYCWYCRLCLTLIWNLHRSLLPCARKLLLYAWQNWLKWMLNYMNISAVVIYGERYSIFLLWYLISWNSKYAYYSKSQKYYQVSKFHNNYCV